MLYRSNIGVGPLASHGASDEIRQEVAGAFEDFGLPLPRGGEYIHIRLGWLVALPDYGAVMRIERNDPNKIVMPLSHPLILQPIGTVTKKELRFELCPGIPHVGISEQELAHLNAAIEKSGLVSEASEDDCGYLPVRTSRHPQGLPVVLDRTDVRWPDRNLTNNFAVNAFSHLDQETVSAQAIFYGPLQRQFEKFQKEKNAGEEAAQQFWRSMRAAKLDKTLFANWEWKIPGMPHDPVNLNKGQEITVSGECYNDSLAADPRHRLILAA